MLLLGPSGTAISRRARRLTIILPEMSLAEAIETARIPRVAGLTDGRTALATSRPFRAPHHAISDVGLIGDGQTPRPGEVSLAHHGVLFLDELPEFRRHVWRCCASPSRRVSYEYNLPRVINIIALTALAERMKTWPDALKSHRAVGTGHSDANQTSQRARSLV